MEDRFSKEKIYRLHRNTHHFFVACLGSTEDCIYIKDKDARSVNRLSRAPEKMYIETYLARLNGISSNLDSDATK